VAVAEADIVPAPQTALNILGFDEVTEATTVLVAGVIVISELVTVIPFCDAIVAPAD